MLGGLVTYSNEAKAELAGVARELIERVGAVSEEVAEAMASGARWRTGADIGVVDHRHRRARRRDAREAGRAGATCARSGAGRSIARRIVVPGSRADVRTRTVTVAMHLIRQLLDETR